MHENTPAGAEVIFTGIGGMGVLSAGQLLAVAALKKYKHVSAVPSYGATKRGGQCQVAVAFSESEIISPFLDEADAVVIYEAAQLDAFAKLVKPGGVVVVESEGLREEQVRAVRDGIKLLSVPGLRIASELGDPIGANFVLLGAYLALTHSVPVELIEQEMESMYTKSRSVLERNQTALRKGIEVAETSS